MTTRPKRTTWVQPGPRLSYSADGSAPCAFGAAGLLGVLSLTAFDRRQLNKRCLSLFYFRAAAVVGCVVSSIAAELTLLL